VFLEYFRTLKRRRRPRRQTAGCIRRRGAISTRPATWYHHRAKDVGKLADGTLFAPKFIENKLKFFPTSTRWVPSAMAAPSSRLHQYRPRGVGTGGETGHRLCRYQELASHPKVHGLIARGGAGQSRPRGRSKMAGAQVRRFLVLPKLLDADDGELTRTRKVRRGFHRERYGALVNALYDGSKSTHIRHEVTFDDGRKGVSRVSGDPRRAGRPAAAQGGLRRMTAERSPEFHRGPALGRQYLAELRRRARAVRYQLRCSQSEVRAIIGPNGAGKSSMLNCINGSITRSRAASRTRDGRKQNAPHEAAEQGIAAPSRTSRWFVACRPSTHHDRPEPGR